MKLWQKGTPLNKQVEAFTVGNDPLLDQKLVVYDCQASAAHVKMLGQIGILTQREVEQLCRELDQIAELSRQNQFQISPDQEDCHTAIENHLTEKLGDLGKKIHTARSRNDQVLTALRLYAKDELRACERLVKALISAIRAWVKKYGRVRFAGYTHTRKAMPTSVAMWGTAFVDAMKDNLKLLTVATTLIDQSPLGTAAGYGVPLKLDRKLTAHELGFKRVQSNPIYAQHSRGKFESTVLHALSQIMFDLNRIASDLIFFSLPEMGYFDLPTEFCTGSSIMPQKQNPDVLELVRAKYHTLLSCELQLRTLTCNLISGYHRDMQLSKEPTLRGFETTRATLGIMALVFENLSVNAERCKQSLTGEVFATEKAYALVHQGVPFREAYRIIAEECEKRD